MAFMVKFTGSWLVLGFFLKSLLNIFLLLLLLLVLFSFLFSVFFCLNPTYRG